VCTDAPSIIAHSTTIISGLNSYAPAYKTISTKSSVVRTSSLTRAHPSTTTVSMFSYISLQFAQHLHYQKPPLKVLKRTFKTHWQFPLLSLVYQQSVSLPDWEVTGSQLVSVWSGSGALMTMWWESDNGSKNVPNWRRADANSTGISTSRKFLKQISRQDPFTDAPLKSYCKLHIVQCIPLISVQPMYMGV